MYLHTHSINTHTHEKTHEKTHQITHEKTHAFTHTLNKHTHTFARACGTHVYINAYGVATVSRIDKIIGLFCRISSLL